MRFIVRTVLPVAALALIAIAVGCHESSSSDRIVGRWVWFNQPTVYIEANGNVRIPGSNISGHWKLTDKVARQYELHWSNGYTDHVTLSPDANSLEGANQNGTRVTATRAP